MNDPVQVSRLTDGVADPSRVFLPLSADLLAIPGPLGFDVYQRTQKDQLEIIFPAGATLKPEQHAASAALGKEGRLYIRADQKEAAYASTEAALPDLISNPRVPLESKCGIVQNLTTKLSVDLFEKPSAQTIRRQKEVVTQMVDLTMKDPSAVRALLGITHHDYYTYTHSVNVGIYSLAIAINHLDPGKHNISEVVSGFFLHDLGKSQIPVEIINKNGPLTIEEWAVMRKHPQLGYDVLEKEKSGSPILATIVCQHHERMDGVGYPLRLPAADIHLYSRICSVADAYDALTTKRSYKPALDPFKALSIMKEEMHSQFDPDVFKTFVLMMQRR